MHVKISCLNITDNNNNSNTQLHRIQATLSNKLENSNKLKISNSGTIYFSPKCYEFVDNMDLYNVHWSMSDLNRQVCGYEFTALFFLY